MIYLAALLLAAALPAASRAQESASENPAAPAAEGKPLWEGGVFAGVARLPHYRGSDEYKVFALPLPFFIYRGEVLQTDREGLRGIFYRSPRIETTVSLSGNPPVDRDNRARRGMPGLDAIGEAGPAAKLYFRRNPSVYLLATIRAAVAADPSHWTARYVGIRGGPSLILSGYQPVPGGRFNCGLAAGLDFSDARYNAYFYDVASGQAISGRAAFRSGGGYAGSYLSGYAELTLSTRLTWAAYARWDNIDAAAYAASPLVKTSNNSVIGTALIWTIRQSSRRVRGRD